MKTFIFFARVGTFLLCTILLQATAAHHAVPDDLPNYVVIGAFAQHNNAIKFTKKASSLKYDAHYDINPNRNLYYVYVLNTQDRAEAIREAIRLQTETPFNDAWVYSGLLGKNTGTVSDNPPGDINPVTQESIVNIEAKETLADTGTELTIENNTEVVDPVSTIAPVEEKTTETVITAEDLEEKNFIFKASRIIDGETVDGEIDVIDKDKDRKMGSYKSNTPVRVSSPASKSGIVTFVCEMFGYRKVEKEFNFKNPSKDVRLDEAGDIIVSFDLARLQTGDIAIMYNVYFFKDAAIIRPESRSEIENLLGMLKENPNYKIKIHGHTNGNSAGKIITMGESKNFFSLTDSRDGYGSAKKLSSERASVIREFMMANGVDENRMEIKAWGGKRPIHDKHATQAHENVRVEIEILDH